MSSWFSDVVGLPKWTAIILDWVGPGVCSADSLFSDRLRARPTLLNGLIDGMLLADRQQAVGYGLPVK